MLTRQRNNVHHYQTDKFAKWFILLAFGYLLLGLLFGSLGSFQYLLPSFLAEKIGFEKSRPLHVYLVISWVFTAAQGIMYYYMPRVKTKAVYWKQGPAIHFLLQTTVSLFVVTGFFLGYFGGREYLEFPPAFALLIALSWLPFAINFFGTLKPGLSNAPVYVWSWTIGILFFFITLAESYLWQLEAVNANTIRDITIQWKALGSMVGSWNMLIYGCTFFLMEKISGDKTLAKSKVTFVMFFVGLTNLMFNWGHHTYSVPASPWIKNVSYLISMTELLIFGQILLKWRKSIAEARMNGRHLTHLVLFFADTWIFLNLALAIGISIPAINFYTHGTHITVAHAMGAMIGINTMLLIASIVFIAKKDHPLQFERSRVIMTRGITVANGSLVAFWVSLIGAGLVKIAGQIDNLAFATIMKNCEPLFKWFAMSGVLIVVGLLLVILPLMRVLMSRRPVRVRPAVTIGANRPTA